MPIRLNSRLRSHRLGPRRKRLSALASVCIALMTQASFGFTHIVQEGDTLASIAERFYGKVQNESLLVVANALEAQGGTRIVPGMRLEVPALTYVRIGKGQTWKELAMRLLGAEYRAGALAQANNSQPWLPPENDSEVIIPYNLRYISTGDETIPGLAYRYLGDRKHAWMLDQYNRRSGKRLVRGDVVLLPVVDIDLTEAGKQAVAQSRILTNKQAGGTDWEAQKSVDAELPELVSDIRQGRFVEAVRRGSQFLASGTLSQSQRAQIQRLLLEAYAALDSVGRAREACQEWLKEDPTARLDPLEMSPKLLASCEQVKP